MNTKLVTELLANAPDDLREYGWCDDPGYGTPVRELDGDTALEFALMAADAVEFLKTFGLRDDRVLLRPDYGKPVRRWPGTNSYVLKHQIERWAGSYVSNGAAIWAAGHIGLAVRRHEDPAFPNARIGVLVPEPAP